MSFPILIFIMLFAGFSGGVINFLLPANENTQTRQKLKPWWQCVILGLGATLMVPLFLEIAQSKLLDHVYFNLSWETSKELESAGKSGESELEAASAKNYLLYFAYCLLAAASGFRFINMLINNVVKEQQISQQNNKIKTLTKEKEKRTKNSQISQQQEETQLRFEMISANAENFTEIARTDPAQAARIINPLPNLPPITVEDDPQKGRFGRNPVRNNRRLKAQVKWSGIPDYYNVTLIVESTDEAKHPLSSDVVLYLHDSFNPSVYRITPAEFKEGKAIDDEILSYGAFTAGAITDDGQTMLELDLAEDSSFPKQFRDR